MLSKVKRYLSNPYYALGYDLIKDHPNWMSDKYFLSVLWKMLMGYELNWKNPKTFNEKLQWLKLYDRNPLYTLLVDKYRVKQWVSEKIGDKYVIPTLSVYDSVDDINLDSLPDKFVLKCNHDSGSVVICRDKTCFDFEYAKRKLAAGLKQNFYWNAREWPYKNVKRCIFAEEFIEDSPMKEMRECGHGLTSFVGLKDYKWFCFSGEPQIMYISNDRSETPTTNVYDMDFNPLPLFIKDPPAAISPGKPARFDKMKAFAAILSEGIPQVRVDFYDNDNDILFGEMTFFHDGGFSAVHPDDWNLKLGDMILLPRKL